MSFSPAVRDFDLYIDGKYTPSVGGRLDVINPTTGRVTGSIADATPEDVDRAVSAAHTSFTEIWSRTSPSERAARLFALADVIEKYKDELAAAEVEDNGKLLREMGGQLASIPRWYRYYAGLADKAEGTTVPMDRDSLFAYTVKEPYGVVACITPWNSPLLLAAYKVAPALAAGNTIVVKPSEHASISTLLFAQCFAEAGFPDGVFNVVTGSGRVAGSELISHPLVQKASFTGSGEGGRAVATTAASRLIETTLELGGKSPNIVFADADIEKAAIGILSGIFAAAGQTCVAGSRVLLHDSVHDAVLERVLERAQRIVIGDPMAAATEMGPIANLPQLAKIEEHVARASAEGAKLVLGGSRLVVEGSETSEGYFYPPTIFSEVAPESHLFQEEVFGPVLAVTRFETDDEALELANNSAYGLAAGVWTNSLPRAQHFAKKLKAGTVWINTYRRFAPSMPFGGLKASGIGTENGISSINSFLKNKSVWIESEPSDADPFAMKL